MITSCNAAGMESLLGQRETSRPISGIRSDIGRPGNQCHRTFHASLDTLPHAKDVATSEEFDE
ncbi:hypothetical protein CA13_63060 [Planctomycetes bacterium CA13]|uniref:Uncharacterized protein n=1 Tax=Novipirellula herctigrandis TaxID=2527986 RepID=A0A5C5ZCF6_9BACT|nr:hypothetical protein CA13_63060 [Planctomycetes bacterium CA13]